jgi:histidinol-phosphate/aromatic aminotransferase/cobyric acid decarboxylase-like protein
MKATRTVYCYYFPEIREIINEIVREYPHKIFLQSIEPGLDDFHFPVIEKFIRYHAKTLPGLKNFKNRYFTNGASEGIFHLLVKIKTENPDAIIYTLKGEYEGYKEYADKVGLNIIEVEENEIPEKQGVFFISNPSARDGNIIPNELINKICEKHKVVYDITYAGLTKKHEFNLDNDSIIAVIASLSKPFGVYYYRIGFTFSRDKIETLEANIWFKNIFSLIIADNLLDKIKHGYFYEKYRALQEKIVKKLNTEEKLNLKASDVLLLANIKPLERLRTYQRGKFCRLCLTPYFLEEEKNEL